MNPYLVTITENCWFLKDTDTQYSTPTFTTGLALLILAESNYYHVKCGGETLKTVWGIISALISISRQRPPVRYAINNGYNS
jgi:hypothetical protein